MIKIKKFTFSPFQENTYILSNESNDCFIIDPGCYDDNERRTLKNYITGNNLKPIKLLNTHCHIDHVFGNRFVYDTYGLVPEYHKMEIPVMEMAEKSAAMYGLNYDNSPKATTFLEENEELFLGDDKLKMLFAPGHAPGHLVFYSEENSFVIGGDVLFHLSIGRTDLPGGDYDTLISSIRNKMFTLPDNTVVYSGHGQETSIGFEKINNPFLNQ